MASRWTSAGRHFKVLPDMTVVPDMPNQEYDNELKGVLFRNGRRTNDRQPTHTGNCQIDGTEYWVSAWVKEGRNGKFFSLAFTKKENQGGQQSAPAKKMDDDFDDDIPF